MFGRIFLICLMFLPATSSVASAETEEGLSSFDELRDQGLLYQRKKRTKLAYRFLTRAYKAEGGKADFKTVYNRGAVAHELLLLEIAFEMLDEAKLLIGDSKRRKRDAAELEVLLNSLYGRLKIEPAPGETNRKGRIFFESQVRIINKKKRTLFKKIRERFRATELSIPTTVYLPHGRFTANNVPVEIAEGETATAHIYLQVDRTPANAGGLNGWWVAGVGAATAIASTFGAYFLFADREPTTVRQLLPSAPPPPGEGDR